jgi:GNAT superfamily N-acetyltransferase
MDQYKAYLEETYHNESCYIDPRGRGWAAYKISGEECYITHCYLDPEFRGAALMSELCQNIEEIALLNGCTFMAGTVDLASKRPDISTKMMLTDGYKMHSANNNIIVFVKKLKKV